MKRPAVGSAMPQARARRRAPRKAKAAGPIRTEHVEAVTFWKAVLYHEPRYPDLSMLFAVPNGGDRHPAVAGKMKAEGVRKGVADYLALVPRAGFHGLAIELKTETGTASPEQRVFLRDARANGYRAEVAHGWAEAWRIVREYFGIVGGGA